MGLSYFEDSCKWSFEQRSALSMLKIKRTYAFLLTFYHPNNYNTSVRDYVQPSIREEKLLAALISFNSLNGFLTLRLSSSGGARVFSGNSRWLSVSTGLVNMIGFGSLAGRVLFSVDKRETRK